MIVAKINDTRILKQHLFEGKNGKYFDIALHENKDGKDQYGNEGFVTQDIGRAAREAGEKGPIIGNWRRLDAKPKPKTAPKPEPTPYQEPVTGCAFENDVPF